MRPLVKFVMKKRAMRAMKAAIRNGFKAKILANRAIRNQVKAARAAAIRPGLARIRPARALWARPGARLW